MSFPSSFGLFWRHSAMQTHKHTHTYIYLPMQARLIWENLAKWHSFRIFKWKLNWNRTDYSKSHVEFEIIYHVLSWMKAWFTSFIFHFLRLSASKRTYQISEYFSPHFEMENIRSSIWGNIIRLNFNYNYNTTRKTSFAFVFIQITSLE